MASYLKLNLPESLHKGLQTLILLEPDQVDELDSALRTTSPTLWPRDFAAAVASKANTDDEKGRIEEVVRALVGLYLARASSVGRASSAGLPIPDFVERVCEAMEETGNEALRPANEDWTTFKARLSRLLNTDQTLGVTSKAVDVMMQQQHAYCTARLMTDLRPVFKSDPAETPEAAVIVHTLKISYHEGDQLKDFFVALDDSDIRELRELLNRAEQKAESLRPLMEAANLVNLGREEH
jgi:hypothetical protein